MSREPVDVDFVPKAVATPEKAPAVEKTPASGSRDRRNRGGALRGRILIIAGTYNGMMVLF